MLIMPSSITITMAGSPVAPLITITRASGGGGGGSDDDFEARMAAALLLSAEEAAAKQLADDAAMARELAAAEASGGGFGGGFGGAPLGFSLMPAPRPAPPSSVRTVEIAGAGRPFLVHKNGIRYENAVPMGNNFFQVDMPDGKGGVRRVIIEA